MKNFVITYFFYAIIALSMVFFSINVVASEHGGEPTFSIYQGTVKGTSVVVIHWPDGVIDNLLYKDKDINGGNNGYLEWFNDRYNAYEKRTVEKKSGK